MPSWQLDGYIKEGGYRERERERDRERERESEEADIKRREKDRERTRAGGMVSVIAVSMRCSYIIVIFESHRLAS